MPRQRALVVRAEVFLAAMALLGLLGACVLPAQQLRIVSAQPAVGAAATYARITDALAAAQRGDTVRISAGTYREPTLVVRVPDLTIVGEGWPTLDAEGLREVIEVRADRVTVTGLTLANTGVSHMEDRAAIRVVESNDCVIAGNRVRNALFGIYLQRAAGCLIRGNDIQAEGGVESSNGNGIHLWHSPGTRVLDNRIRGQRDGIYFEFSHGAIAERNEATDNIRYGLHFMFSDSAYYAGNTFARNRAGVAVMYSRAVVMRDNGFLEATGSAAYALLLKEISDGELIGNRFVGSSTGLFLEGVNRLQIRDNEFRANGWAVRLMGDALDNHFTGNRFSGNAFDVASNARTIRSSFDGNWWDGYRGYDLDRDGFGDVPFHPVRLFAMIVEKHPAALVLLRSPAAAVLDAAERVFPVLTPDVSDPNPLMRPPR